MRFRPATPADVPSISRLVWAERMNPLGLDPARFLVADAEEGMDGDAAPPSASSPPPPLAAIGQIVRLDSAPGEFEVRSLVVAPGRRGRGLGSALLAALLDSAGGGAPVWLTTLACRAPFYERAGFEVVTGGGGRENKGTTTTSLLGGLFFGGGSEGKDDSTPVIPSSMRFEVLAGAVVGPLLGGDRLVVMCRRGKQ